MLIIFQCFVPFQFCSILLSNTAVLSNTYVHMGALKHMRLSVPQIKVPQIKDPVLQSASELH